MKIEEMLRMNSVIESSVRGSSAPSASLSEVNRQHKSSSVLQESFNVRKSDLSFQSNKLFSSSLFWSNSFSRSTITESNIDFFQPVVVITAEINIKLI